MNTANKITISRIVLSIVIMILLLFPFGQLGLDLPSYVVNDNIYVELKYIIAGVLFIIASLTDFFDGYIARKYNMITDFGKFMDQIADKFITTTAMILVLFGKASVTANWLAILMLLIVVLRDILISGIRMVAANKNVVIAADIFGKVKSFFLDLASMILILYIGLTAVTSCNFLKYIQVFGLSLMIIGVALTIVSCVNYTVQAIKKLTAQEVELTTADDKDDEE